MQTQNVGLDVIAQSLYDAPSLVIISHVSPDGDCVGSQAGLGLALRAMGKRVYLLCADEIPFRLRFFFSPPGQVPLDFYTDPALIDAKNAKPVAVAVDVASLERMGNISDFFDIEMKIDHHAQGGEFGKYSYVDPTASATGEIIYEIITNWNENGLLSNEAYINSCALLYGAIASDSGCFRFSNTTQRTFLIAAKMKEVGVDFSWVNKELYESRDLGDIVASSAALCNLELLYDGRVSLILITVDLMRRYNVKESDFGAVVGIARSIKGVRLSITIKQRISDPCSFKISTRSDENFDCASFCSLIGGGGHLRAAGADIVASSPELARERILNLLKDFIG